MTTESMKPYPAYKDSGIEWIGKIPEGWDVKKLKWLADVKLSNIDKKSKEDEPTVKLCNYVDVYYNDNITPNIKFMVATASKNQINALSLEKGDVLITKDSESPDDIAVPAFVPESLSGIVCGYHLARIRPNENAYGNYLFRSFLSNGIRDQFEMNANGITRFGIGKYTIDNSLFLVPPLTEQQSIATFLDNQTAKIDTLIENKQKQIELLKEERTAIINQAVTKGLNPDVPMRDSGIEWLGEIPEHWDVKPLFTVAHEQKTKNKSGLEKNVLSLSYGNIIRRNVESNFGLLPESFNTYQIINSGNIILRLTDLQNDKRSLRVGLVKETGIITSAYVCLKGNDDFDPKYVYDLLHSYDLIKVFYTMGGGLRQTLRFEELKRLPMLCPPLQEQNEITIFLTHHANKIDTVIENNKNQITLLQEYRTALISEAVTGKIDLRNQHEISTLK